MRHYEIVLLIHPGQEEQIPSMLDRYQAIISKAKGKVHRLEEWGRLQLAYPVAKCMKAYFVLLNVEVDQDALSELKKAFIFNDVVLRHLIIKETAALTETSAMMKKLAKEKEEDSKNREEKEAEDKAEDKADAIPEDKVSGEPTETAA